MRLHKKGVQGRSGEKKCGTLSHLCKTGKCMLISNFVDVGNGPKAITVHIYSRTVIVGPFHFLARLPLLHWWFFLDVFCCQCPLEFLSFFSFQFKTNERKNQVTSHCVRLLIHPPSFTVFCSYFNRIPRVLSYSDVGEIERITLAPPFWSSRPFILWVVTEAFSQTTLPSTPNYRFVSTCEPMLY